MTVRRRSLERYQARALYVYLEPERVGIARCRDIKVKQSGVTPEHSITPMTEYQRVGENLVYSPHQKDTTLGISRNCGTYTKTNPVQGKSPKAGS